MVAVTLDMIDEQRALTGEIILYSKPDGTPLLDVRLDEDTVWLSQAQMVSLFDKDLRTISEHVQNVFKEGELDASSVIRKFRITAKDGKKYKVNHYNLDVVISVGYRVKSSRGTQFRIWATKVLREHLLRGFTVYEKRLLEQKQRWEEMQQTMGLLGRMIEKRSFSTDESDGLLQVIAEYAKALDLLDDYDHQRLKTPQGLQSVANEMRLTYEMSRSAIKHLGEKTAGASDLFGREKDNGLQGTLGAIYQSFNGQDLYPSIDEKAAHLLYFVVKNHAFVDGNKRIGAFLFLWFLSMHNALYGVAGAKRLSDSTIVALTLLIAESKPDEKEIMTKLILLLLQLGSKAE